LHGVAQQQFRRIDSRETLPGLGIAPSFVLVSAVLGIDVERSLSNGSDIV